MKISTALAGITCAVIRRWHVTHGSDWDWVGNALIETGFVQFVQVVKGLASAFQSWKVFDYAFWFWENRDAIEVERQIVEVEKNKKDLDTRGQAEWREGIEMQCMQCSIKGFKILMFF